MCVVCDIVCVAASALTRACIHTVADISDTWANGGIVVYDFVNDRSRRFDHVSLRGVDNTTIIINGVPFPMATPSDGIALTPDGLWVYYWCDGWLRGAWH